jgi:hypothetical protein
MGRAPSHEVGRERVVLAVDWQWGDRHLRAGLAGTVIGNTDFPGRCLVMLDCFTEDSQPQSIDVDMLRGVEPSSP